ncbi:MAG: hypothetical protein JEY97_06420 [Bacteroidales bacterium]|nr:hypothetical protein [Bacteroidales bacterium]
MRAIEIASKTDARGHLKIDCQLDSLDSNVRVIILLDDNIPDQDEEKLWMSSISKNPAFDFLNDPSEDVYSINDGVPFND